jgi:hypothetical protein
MRFLFGLLFSLIGLALFLLGVLTPENIDPTLAASGQRRGTLFFFGILLCIAGLSLIFIDFVNIKHED